MRYGLPYAEKRTKGPYTYTVKDGKATITGYTGPGGAVNIPIAPPHFGSGKPPNLPTPRDCPNRSRHLCKRRVRGSGGVFILKPGILNHDSWRLQEFCKRLSGNSFPRLGRLTFCSDPQQH